jgi:hypothetical protein
MTYRALDADAIIATCTRLNARIDERFRGSGLSKVAQEVLAVARETTANIDRIRRPRRSIRYLVGGLIVLMLAIIVGLAVSVPMPSSKIELFPLLQIAESAVNDLIFLGVAVFFLSSLEARVKRHEALQALHQLRSLAHVIDMHQLTKDPEQLLSPAMSTASSPQRSLSRFELGRYLDYCTEMLAILSKLAALYVQDFDDPQVLGAVNDIQGLTTGLSSNIWQKIVILDNLRIRGAVDGEAI